MEWWWYALIALGGIVGIGAALAAFLPENQPDLVPMGGHYVVRPPDPPKPRKRWQITITRN
jgi:hypothetical protein